METKEFSYNKIVKNGDDCQVELYYFGTSKKNIDILKVENLLDKFMYNIHHGNAIETMRFLNTMLKDFKQKKLFFDYDAKDRQYSLEYRDSELYCYCTELKNKKNPKIIELEITYTLGEDLEIRKDDKNSDTIEYLTNDDTLATIKNIFNEVKRLKNVDIIKLEYSSKMLIQIYKLFYKEYPDFSNIKETNIKTQTMVYILSELGYPLQDYCNFSSYGNGAPMDLNLATLTRKLFPLAKIEMVNDPIPLNKAAVEVISYTGSRIKDVVADDDKEQELEKLMRLSQIMYSSRNRVSPIGDIEKVKEDTNCTQEEIQTNLQLIKSIEESI